MGKEYTGIEVTCTGVYQGQDYIPMYDGPMAVSDLEAFEKSGGIWIAPGCKLWLVGQDRATGMVRVATQDGAYIGWMLARNLKLG